MFNEPNSWMQVVSDLMETYNEVRTESEDSSDDDYDEFILTRNTTTSSSDDDNVCRAEVWKCMSGVLETGIKYMDTPGDVYQQLTPVLYKAVFHGGLKSMWSSIMEVRIIENYFFRFLNFHYLNTDSTNEENGWMHSST